MKKILLLTALIWIVSCQSKNEESLKDLDSSQTAVTPKEPTEEPQTPTVPEELVEPTEPQTPEDLTAPSDPPDPTTPKEPEESTYPPLKGTTWKLAGFADIETGNLRKAKPEDCKLCYTLTFDTDTTFSGQGSSNQIQWAYKIDYGTSQIHINMIGQTKIVPYFDEKLFVETVNMAQSFSLQEDELRLYYNNGKNYLLFKNTTQ